MSKKIKPDGPLASCAKRSLEKYFRELNGEKTIDLYDMVICEVEKPMLEVVMKYAESNQCRAAEILGINRNTLRKKLLHHGLIK